MHWVTHPKRCNDTSNGHVNTYIILTTLTLQDLVHIRKAENNKHGQNVDAPLDLVLQRHCQEQGEAPS
jgi:hypothetical protein